MSLATVRPGRAREVLGNRDVLLLLGAGLVSQTGDWLLDTGVAYEVYALTGSTIASAAVLLATQLPQLLLGSAAGVVVDRRDRRRTMIQVNLGLAAVLLPLLAVRDPGQVWIVVVVVAASSCLAPFFTAAEASLLPAVVPPHLLVTVNALNGQVRNVARLVGAALGGLAVAAGGFVVLALADLATFLVAVLLLSLIRHRPEPVELPEPHPLRDWLVGLAAIRGSRPLVAVLLFFVLSGLGEGVMSTLFAPFVRDVLGGTAALYGTILAAQAVGGILGGFAVLLVAHRVPPRLLLGWGAVAFGGIDLALFLYPLAVPAAWPAILLIALVGLPGAALSAGQLTLFQLGAPDVVRGRVFGTLTTAHSGTALLGTAAAGLLAAHAGILPVIVVQGSVQVLGGALVLVLLRSRA